MIHNRPFYHCQCCGAVVAQEAYRLPPFCCGREMIRAGEEALLGNFAHELDIEPALVEPRLAPRWVIPERGCVVVST